MKSIQELSKSELIGLIHHHLPDTPFSDPCCECAVCGETADAQYYYICDDCEKLNDDEE